MKNPYIFLKNNFFLQFLIADRFRIYRHIVACSSLLLFFILGRQWGDYEGMIDYWNWIEKWLGITATFYLNMYVLIPRFFFKGKLATYIILLTLWVLFYVGLYLLSQFCTMERLYDWERNQNSIRNSCFCSNFFLVWYI